MTEEGCFRQEAGPESNTMVCAQPTSHLVSWIKFKARSNGKQDKELQFTDAEVHWGWEGVTKGQEVGHWASSQREEQELGYLLCSGGRG